MKTLITGAGGFVARTVTAELEGSHELRLTDRCRPEEATVMNWDIGKREAAPLNTQWPYVQAELTDPAAIQRAVEGMDDRFKRRALENLLLCEAQVMESNLLNKVLEPADKARKLLSKLSARQLRRVLDEIEARETKETISGRT